MKVIYDQLPSRKLKCAATIGVFDGIHLGHQLIFKHLKKQAKTLGVPSLVITFDISPKAFLNKNLLFTDHKAQRNPYGYITNIEDKINLIKSSEIDYVWVLKTTNSLLKMSADDFLSFSRKHFDINKIVVGEDFRFGHKAQADLKYLAKLGDKYNFKVTAVRKKIKNKAAISSSLIRKFVGAGKLKQAKEILGRDFSIKGEVQRGQRLGKALGFPTANISAFDCALPSIGVYAAHVILRKKTYLAAVNVGLKPTVSDAKRDGIEAHIIGFKGDILGETIRIIFLEKFRPEKKFPSLEALSTAVKKDIKYITAKYSTLPVERTQPLVP